MASRPVSLGGRNTVPAPYLPRPGSSRPSFAQAAARNACGVCSRMPAPSPVSFSAPVAPRCSRLQRTSSALTTMSCEGRPLMSTTNPKPQESCSSAGSYRPCAGGGPESAMFILSGPPGPETPYFNAAEGRTQRLFGAVRQRVRAPDKNVGIAEAWEAATGRALPWASAGPSLEVYRRGVIGAANGAHPPEVHCFWLDPTGSG